MPFWRTTPTRVPEGTVILSPEPICGAAGLGAGATGGGAADCGPSRCWAAQDMLVARKPAINHRNGPKPRCSRFFRADLDYGLADGSSVELGGESVRRHSQGYCRL